MGRVLDGAGCQPQAGREFRRRAGVFCFSVSALLVPAIRADAGGALNLRRLQILVYWGEAPHTLALALLPVAIVCFVHALTTDRGEMEDPGRRLAAGVVLSNTFRHCGAGRRSSLLAAGLSAPAMVEGAVDHCAIGVVRLLLDRLRRMSPSMLARFGPSHGGRAIFDSQRRPPSRWRFSAAASAFVVGSKASQDECARAVLRPFWIRLHRHRGGLVRVGVAVIPQPSRYQLEMDLALCWRSCSAGRQSSIGFPRRVRSAVAVAVMICLALETVHAVSLRTRFDSLRRTWPPERVQDCEMDGPEPARGAGVHSRLELLSV